MKVHGRWRSFADLAALLEQQWSRDAMSADLILNQLHTLIRVPFEILQDYCKDYDKANSARQLWQEMQGTPWFHFARIVRNAISHNFHFHFQSKDKLPITWNGITLSQDMEGQRITYEMFYDNIGYELFLEMRSFAEALPGEALPDDYKLGFIM